MNPKQKVKVVAQRLRKAREDLGLSQKDVHLEAGIGINTLFRVEQGLNTTLETIFKLLECYELPLSYLDPEEDDRY